jgi:hypothetical protein
VPLDTPECMPRSRRRPSTWKRMTPLPDKGSFGFKAIGAGAATPMSGFLDDGTAFRLGGTDGKPVVGFRMATATTGETAAGVSAHHWERRMGGLVVPHAACPVLTVRSGLAIATCRVRHSWARGNFALRGKSGGREGCTSDPSKLVKSCRTGKRRA